MCTYGSLGLSSMIEYVVLLAILEKLHGTALVGTES